MSDFINTIDQFGDDVVLKSIIDGNITEFKDDVLTLVGGYAFYKCTELVTVDLPNVTKIGAGSTDGSLPFGYCTSLKNVHLPNLTTLDGHSCFYNCALEKITLPKCTAISSQSMFSGCSNLKTIILGSDSICRLSYENALLNTPIASGTGYVYVPLALLDSYKTHSSWPRFANQLRAIEGGFNDSADKHVLSFNSSKVIELSYYLPVEDPDATLQNIQIVSSDNNLVTVGDINVYNGYLTFNVNSLTTEGSAVLTVSADFGDVTVTKSFNVTVYENIPEATYRVESVDGASYGFALNEDGYYESQNKKKSSSAAVCKVIFDTKGIYNLYLDCINSGQGNYDFGILSNIDETLSTTSGSDSSNKVFKSFSGQSSLNVVTLDYGIPTAGEHFIYVKFKKNSSGDQGNDSLQFKVRFEM